MDHPNPIPDPRLGNPFPVWAIIALSVVGLMGVGVLIWYFRKEKKRTLAKGLEEYEQIDSRH